MTTIGAAGRVGQYTLDNGLRLVTAPASTGQVASVNLWYGVGSRHEVPGRTGFAHLFEHLMFQGSGNVDKGEHFEEVERLGGDINASTSTDRTNYYETVPEHALDRVLWLEADRLETLRDGMTQEVLDNQRDVVKNERRQRYDNQPYGTALERILRLAYPEGHPDEAELARLLHAAVAAGVPFKCTAGLHHAVRHTSAEGFQQHGFLNVLLATHTLLSGAGPEEAADVLAERDGPALAARIGALTHEEAVSVRRAFRSFGTCSVTEPLEDLVVLGALPAARTR